jgi:hypothetical protein
MSSDDNLCVCQAKSHSVDEELVGNADLIDLEPPGEICE